MPPLGTMRSMLYAPGSDPRMMRKALDAGADAIIFDLEDAVASDRKSEARTEIARLLDNLAATGAAHPPVFVRINASSSGMREADLDAAVRPGLAGLKLPKTESADELTSLDAACSTLESERGLPLGSVVVIPGIESARGLQEVDAIARSARVWCLSFGAVDFAHDLGTEPSADGTESFVALSTIAIASAAAGLHRPMDSAWSDITDEGGLHRTSRLARRLGFQGKAVIHPRQVPVVNDVFGVSEGELSTARAIVEQADHAALGGRGALQVEGSLVDAAHVRRARALLELYRQRHPEETDA
jgi:citrate lyase subunit beta / citryl-CoA lyase